MCVMDSEAYFYHFFWEGSNTFSQSIRSKAIIIYNFILIKTWYLTEKYWTNPVNTPLVLEILARRKDNPVVIRPAYFELVIVANGFGNNSWIFNTGFATKKKTAKRRPCVRLKISTAKIARI